VRRWLLPTLLALATNAPASNPICLTVQPKIAQAPSDVHVKIFVPRHPANRWLDIVIEGENFGTSSSRQLDGEQALGVFDVWFKNIPCGSYAALAQVTGPDGRSFTARGTFTLIGFSCENP
jgi:hypothetical protein